ncbi:ricin-type beta-trefoil lectin domain protein [Streptomyces sp. NPDC088812]|uniref:ricin-type beta-trefoil lectin domain protein n=1 Tax=Streptomyces sp. NPDC088812 TaxID=3365905 RepID=UPI003803C2AD
MSILSHASQRCLDVVGGRPAAGAPLMIWDCSGSASQRWTFPSDGTMRTLGMCVELADGSTADGAGLRLAACDGGPAQRFELNHRHDVVSGLADKCADVVDGATGNGTRVQVWTCGGQDNQKWSAS